MAEMRGAPSPGTRHPHRPAGGSRPRRPVPVGGPCRRLPSGAVADIRRVTVYCGSSLGHRPAHAEAARDLGRLLADEGIAVVYGGTHVGLMGVLADAALDAGGDVTGVIAEQVMAVEVPHAGLADLRVVGSMAERKALLIDLADAVIALPGGYGTLEELFQTLTALQLGLHVTPCAVLDVEGWFEPLVAQLDRAVDDGLLSPGNRGGLLVDDDPVRLLERLRAWVPDGVGKRVDPIS